MGHAKEGWTIAGPGAYLPDATEGIANVEDLPKTEGGSAQSQLQSTLPVRAASGEVDATAFIPESSTTSATWWVAGRGTSIWSTRSIIVRDAVSVSMPTCPSMRCPSRTTLTVSFPWQCDSSSKMAYPTKPQVGTCGAITGSLFLLPPSRTGRRPGGKRRPGKCGPAISTGPSVISPAISLPTNCTTDGLSRPHPRAHP